MVINYKGLKIVYFYVPFIVAAGVYNTTATRVVVHIFD